MPRDSRALPAGWNRRDFLKLTAAAGAGAVLPFPLRAATAGGGLVEEALGPRSGPRGATLFTRLSPQDTGLITTNNYADPVAGRDGYRDPRMWADRFHVFEVGAVGTGVAMGDYDGDGRVDVFVVSKTESCRLFRNLGGWKFEDVTAKAGVEDVGEAARIWKQGACFVDINNDGLLDIYVCRFNAPNLLYINQGDGTFKEMAHAYGLDVKDACVMAAFCDYDRDGKLDVFVQTNLLDPIGHPTGQRDYLFHNNGDGTFTDVSVKAGLAGEAQGHSALWWDYDNDGWPDLYVANDFAAPDQLYRNNRDGTFTNVIDQVLPHLPYSSMGSDLGDVDNDGLIDLLATDMAPSSHEKDQRTIANERALNVDPSETAATAAPQYARNALYLNTGTGRCREAACLAGIAATDWTWAVRWEDLDNDGRLDLFVTNGMHREVTNIDLIRRIDLADSAEEKIRIERNSPVLNERHLAYRNLGGLRFAEVGKEWGLDAVGVSFGVAMGDLDGDGDLDIVYANYHGGVTVLRNDSQEGHRILVALRGTRSNRFGIGATVRLESASGLQVRQLTIARGVLSSSEPVAHFGLGSDDRIRKLTVLWPSGAAQVFTDLGVDRRFTITEPAEGPAGAETPVAANPRFREVSQALGLALATRETPMDELLLQPLLPERQNRGGPSVAVGDVDGDGEDEVVVGGTPGDGARVLKRGGSGEYRGWDSAVLASEWPLSDGPVLLFDADGDGRDELLITKGGSGLPDGSPDYQPKLFAYDGQGGFRAGAEGVLPALAISAGVAVAADFDRDGRLDLFIGGRVRPGQYPLPAQSALLRNVGGRFEDVTERLAPGLQEVGLVTAALWSDVDGDGWLDLLLTLEWGTVRYFHNDQGKGFTDWSERSGFAAAGTGWWSSIAAADFNGDGKMDYVVGNVGLNTPYQASAKEPALLFLGDFKGDGSSQLLEAYYEAGQLYPRRTRKELGAAIPSILQRFQTNNAYAKATLEEIVGAPQLAQARRFAATEFRSGVFLSQPDGTFRFEPLPRIAQIAPFQGLVAGDFDGDGRADIYAVQNSYAPIPSVGRFDGGLSQLLLGDGRGGFAPVPPAQSGLVVPGDAKALCVCDWDHSGWPGFLISRNNSSLLAFRQKPILGRNSLLIRLQGPPGNPHAIGARLSLTLKDGSSQMAELHAGSGYRSQSPPLAPFGFLDSNPPASLSIRWPNGKVSRHAPPTRSGCLKLAMT